MYSSGVGETNQTASRPKWSRHLNRNFVVSHKTNSLAESYRHALHHVETSRKGNGKNTNLASAFRSYGVVLVSIRRFDEFNEFLLPMDAEFLVDVNDVRVNRILGDKQLVGYRNAILAAR